MNFFIFFSVEWILLNFQNIFLKQEVSTVKYFYANKTYILSLDSLNSILKS